jgi:hypothetical protein
MERNRPSEAYSLPEDRRGRGLSGHEKKPSERGPLTSWRRQREGLVRTRKETDRARPTHSLETVRGGLVRTQKETDRARPTHFLESAEGVTCQDTERDRPTEAHSLPGYGRKRDLSGHGKKPTKRGPLTSWRSQSDS